MIALSVVLTIYLFVGIIMAFWKSFEDDSSWAFVLLFWPAEAVRFVYRGYKDWLRQ